MRSHRRTAQDRTNFIFTSLIDDASCIIFYVVEWGPWEYNPGILRSQVAYHPGLNTDHQLHLYHKTGPDISNTRFYTRVIDMHSVMLIVYVS